MFMLLFVVLMQQFWMGIVLHTIEIHHMSGATNRRESRSNSDGIDSASEILLHLRNATTTTSTRLTYKIDQAAASPFSTKPINVPSNTAFLIYYVPPHPGQGTGNLISGLLAAHRLGQEFHRTVCHTGYESSSSFGTAFAYKESYHASICAKILRRAPPPNDNITIVQNNFDETAVQSECVIRDLLQDHTQHSILYYKGNTYPRWPTERQHRNRFFDSIFQPTLALRNVLPWDTPPRVVVQLRDGDDFMDRRQGLDEETLDLLAQESFLSRHYGSISPEDRVFLVTNRVEWYDRFPEWDHPPWSLVHHSALGRISWGPNSSKNMLPQPQSNSKRQEGLLQMWADWYTLLNAKIIVHSRSDFSLSAARWNEGIDSYTIHGTRISTTKVGTLLGKEYTELELRPDFELDPNQSATRRLVDRTDEELRFCDPAKSEEEKKDYKEQKLQQMLAMVKARRQHRGLDPLPGFPQKQNESIHVQPPPRELPKSFLIYHHISGDGQGTGNIISGVLAAHLLAEEFNRTVCHYGLYRYESSMGRAFQWIDDRHTKLCEKALDIAPPPNDTNRIIQRNFDRTAKRSECELKELLSNHQDYPFLYYNGNTYPRWPTSALSQLNRRDYFHEFYEPTSALLAILPWNVSNPPSTVIHLRQGDNQQDRRSGLDEQSLSLLSEYNFTGGTSRRLRNHDIFLVTNRVEWYHRFPSWFHPSWDMVPHSSFGPMDDWGDSNRSNSGKLPLFDKDGHNQKRQAQEASKLQMWADWYTLVRAEQIYHTHSDFSLSAARWNRWQLGSWTIRGCSNGTSLLLQRDFQDVEDDVVPALAERTSSQLKYCS
ncbi:hypothetical protein IV203_008212 [Nitzschia inconspicua]|uniref:Uncharacterized protein n=1 Tax=Nitzschia inconspicua TaxID=303405 RepID=A0A9K3KZ94_9STRA|nr:hypothetical protein IV203_008212 [Nitzschia inconspicua]